MNPLVIHWLVPEGNNILCYKNRKLMLSVIAILTTWLINHEKKSFLHDIALARYEIYAVQFSLFIGLYVFTQNTTAL